MKRYTLGATQQGYMRDGCMIEDIDGEYVRYEDHAEKVNEIIKRLSGPGMPQHPTMGMWDDFCTVHKVPFEEFNKAAQAMLDGLRLDATGTPQEK